MCGTNKDCYAVEWREFESGKDKQCRNYNVPMKGNGSGNDTCFVKASGGHLSWFIAKDFTYMRQIIRDN